MQKHIENGIGGVGDVTIVLEDGGISREMHLKNKVVVGGRHWLARALGNQFGGSTDIWVSTMSFGSGGYLSAGSGSGPIDFPDTRSGLFAPIPGASVNVAPSQVTDGSYRVTFTGKLPKSVGNGYSISEMGLFLKNGTMFSMVTMPPIDKVDTRTITVYWTISLLSGS